MGKEKKILIITIIVLTLVFACILAFYFKDTSDIIIANRYDIINIGCEAL